jgi:hypothetical protein
MGCGFDRKLLGQVDMTREFITNVLSGYRITIIPVPVPPKYLVPRKNVGSGIGAGSKLAHPRCDNRKDYLEPYDELIWQCIMNMSSAARRLRYSSRIYR